MKTPKNFKVRNCLDSLQWNPKLNRTIEHETPQDCPYVRESTGVVMRKGQLINVNEHNKKTNRYYREKKRKPTNATW